MVKSYFEHQNVEIKGEMLSDRDEGMSALQLQIAVCLPPNCFLKDEKCHDESQKKVLISSIHF